MKQETIVFCVVQRGYEDSLDIYANFGDALFDYNTRLAAIHDYIAEVIDQGETHIVYYDKFGNIITLLISLQEVK
jgi:hypothetical protein